MPDAVGRPTASLATGELDAARGQSLLSKIEATPSAPALLDAHAERRPGAIALACCSAQHGWVRADWARFAEDTRRAAAGLRGLGVERGEHVAVLLDNRNAYECFVVHVALLRRGCVLVPLNTRSTGGELAHALEAADCHWLVAGTDTAEAVRAAQASVRHLRGVIGLGDVPQGWLDWQGVLAHAPGAADEAAVGPDAASGVLFTSGTTARPKGAVHTHRTAIATGAIYAEGLGLRSTDVLHHAIPFFTSSGAQAFL